MSLKSVRNCEIKIASNAINKKYGHIKLKKEEKKEEKEEKKEEKNKKKEEKKKENIDCCECAVN